MTRGQCAAWSLLTLRVLSTEVLTSFLWTKKIYPHHIVLNQHKSGLNVDVFSWVRVRQFAVIWIKINDPGSPSDHGTSKERINSLSGWICRFL